MYHNVFIHSVYSEAIISYYNKLGVIVVMLEHYKYQFIITYEGSRNTVGNRQSLCTNLRIGDISTPVLKQTKAKLQFIITNSRLCNNYYYSIITYDQLTIISRENVAKADFNQ